MFFSLKSPTSSNLGASSSECGVCVYLVNFPGDCPVFFCTDISAFARFFGKQFHRLVLYEELCLVCFDEVPNSFISYSLTQRLSAKLSVFSTSPCHMCFCRTLPYVPFLILSSLMGRLANTILLILVGFFLTYRSSGSTHLEMEDQNRTMLRTCTTAQRFSAFFCFFPSNS